MPLCFYVFQVSKRSLVVNHLENPSTFPTNSSHAEAFSSHNITYTSHNEVYSSSPEKWIVEQAKGEEDKDNILHVNTHQIIIQTKQELVIDIC